MSRPHPEFKDKPEMTLYRCWDSSLIDEEDVCENNIELQLKAELDQDGAGALAADDFAMFKLGKNDFGPEGASAGPLLKKPRVDKAPKEEKSADAVAKGKLKAKLRQINDWVMDSKGWPDLLKDSPADADTVKNFTCKFQECAGTFQKLQETGLELASKGNAAAIETMLEQIDAQRDQFTKFLGVAKRLLPPKDKAPSAKAKTKAKAKAKAAA